MPEYRFNVVFKYNNCVYFEISNLLAFPSFPDAHFYDANGEEIKEYELTVTREKVE